MPKKGLSDFNKKCKVKLLDRFKKQVQLKTRITFLVKSRKRFLLEIRPLSEIAAGLNKTAGTSRVSTTFLSSTG